MCAVVQSLQGHEVFDQSLAADAVRSCLDELRVGDGRCTCCGRAVSGLSVFSADIDQAFESCDGANVAAAWSWAKAAYAEKHGTGFV